ncbi:MAG: hypothetical protein M1812_005125 [Candelaria pacifica]|nr:MAG: hypothetical protein M1812_005125 [Candelaria pacifica]
MEPITITEGSPPRWIYFNQENHPPVVIDLERDDDDDDERGFAQDDNLSDIDIERLFPKHSEDELLQSVVEVEASVTSCSTARGVERDSAVITQSTLVPFFQSNGHTIKPGKTIELDDRDFLYVKEIRKNAQNEIIVSGYRLRRVRDLVGVDKKRNELALMLEVDEEDRRSPMDQGIERLRLEALRGIRTVVFTNSKYPTTSYRDDPQQHGQGLNYLQTKGRLFCRQKLINTINVSRSRAGNKVTQTCLQFLSQDEADMGAGEKDEELRRAWRGLTIAGGACSGILRGESDFDEAELKAVCEFQRKWSSRQSSRSNRSSIANLANERAAAPITPARRQSRQLFTPGSRDCPIKLEDDLSSDYNVTIDLSEDVPSIIHTPRHSRTAKRQRSSQFDDTPIHFSLSQHRSTRSTQDEAKGTIAQANNQRRYTFGDAFCGAGGASRGAKMAGLRVAWGNDFDTAAINSYQLNFHGTYCYAMWAHDFINEINDEHIVDILHISPPCQVFSPAHTTPGKDDEMNTQTFFACQELLRRAKPRLATMENTFGLIQNHREYLATAVCFFTSLGYSVRWKISNFAEYGLPQARRRAFFIAACPGERLPDFPLPTHSNDPERCLTLGLKPFVTVNDAISQIPANFPNHDIKEASKARVAYDGDRQLSRCITTSGGDNYHPSGTRSFTDREFACLQGFPLEHKFGKTRVRKQIGNAVPPSVAKVIFEHLKNALLRADGLA